MNFTVYTQLDLQTTKHRNMVIDLGNGLETNARLNLPDTGNGPYPAILLVPGTGKTDMNETAGYIRIDNETDSLIYPLQDIYFKFSISKQNYDLINYIIN